MPQPFRLSSNQSIAGSSETGALVINATSSSLRPWVWRNSRAAWRAKGKPTSSGLTGAVRMTRFSGRPLLISCVRAWVGLGGSGGKIRLGSGYFLFDVGPQGGLIVFYGQQVMAPRLQDHRAGGFILRVQGI
jgi:hypothetical protein